MIYNEAQSLHRAAEIYVINPVSASSGRMIYNEVQSLHRAANDI